MNKKKSIFFAIFLVAILVFSICHLKSNIDYVNLYSVIISTDGNIVPGQRQDFLVNIFRKVDGTRIFENRANFGLKLKMTLVNGKKKEAIVPLTCNSSGKYICSYLFPEDLDFSDVDVSVFPDNMTNQTILHCLIPVKKENAIVVKPPESQIYIGENISFSIASIDLKSGLSQFKIPVRVKLIAPSGYTTLNRIVTTNQNGLATFETAIHPASPEGYYTFVFSTNNFSQKISVYIKKNSNKNSVIDSIPFYSPTQITNENCGFIYNLLCEETNALLAYGCPESEHRQIEIWQNGKLHYFSDLALEGGTISLVFDKSNPLLPGCPVLFKVWQINGDNVSSHEKIRYLPFHNPNQTGQFLIDVNSEFQNTDKDKLAIALARKGFIGATSEISVENLTQPLSLDLTSIQMKPQNEIPIEFYDNLLKKVTNIKESVFYLVEQDMDLKDTNKLKIFLNTPSFLKEYISYLRQQEYNLETMLQEAICRIDLYPYLDLSNKEKDIYELEGLIIPLSELYSYLNKFQDKKSIYAPQILSSINKIKDLIFVPAEFTFDLVKYRNLNHLPMLDIKPVPRSLQSIQGLLRQNGKILLSNENASATFDLNQSSFEVSDYDWDKLINLRTLPLITLLQ